MKKYTLEAIVQGKDIKITKTFKTRNSALLYMLEYYNKKGFFNMQVEDEYPFQGNKHNIEYVCDYHNRFRINRVVE